MGKLNRLLLTAVLFMTGLALHAQPRIAATVISVKGEAYVMSLSDKSKMNLSPGLKIFAGSKIIAGKNSEVVLELANGTRRVVPARSELVIGDKDNIEVKSLLDQKIDTLTAFVGLKASGEETTWYQKDTERYLGIKKAYEAGDFPQVIRLAEEKSPLEGAEYLYMTAGAYLRLNIPAQALVYYKKALVNASPQLKAAATKGIFLSHLKAGNKAEAKKIIKELKSEKDFKAYQELLEK